MVRRSSRRFRRVRRCAVPPEQGYIAVFKHPFFAVTDKDGAFDLKNLPPGNYTITAWQEKLGTQTQKVTITAGKEDTGFHF